MMLPENIPSLIRASNTTCTLASTFMAQATRINVGGRQYRVTSTLTLNTATTGFGGLDTGALGSAHQLYYVYAVVQNGAIGLCASLTDPVTGPSGFSGRYRLVGAFYVQDTAVIGSTVTISGTATSEPQSWTVTAFGTGTFGSDGVMTTQWQRIADYMHFRIQYLQSIAGTAGSGNYTIPLPTGLSIDTSKENTGASFANICATGYLTGTGSPNDAVLVAIANGGTSLLCSYLPESGGAGAIFASGAATFNLSNATVRVSLKGRLPISGWKTTLL